MKNKIFLFGFLLFFVATVNATDISSCSEMYIVGTYYLTSDIIDNNPATRCMVIDGANVTLDCQGHTIDGVDSTAYGIRVISGDATIKNCIFSDWTRGIFLDNVYDGHIYIYNNSIVSNSYGIYTDDSEFDLFDSEILNSVNRGIYFTGSTQRDNIFFQNVKIENISDNSGIGFQLDKVSNSYFNNVSISNSIRGMTLGLYVFYNDFYNISILNTDKGLGSSSRNSSFISMNIKNNNVYGLLFDSPEFSNVTHSTFINNSVDISSISDISSLLIYNNFFNSTKYYNSTGAYNAIWNISIQEGNNIFCEDNLYIAGNFFANQTGNGYSEICVDADGNGFCDDAYNISGANMDYMPISNNFIPNTPPQIDYTSLENNTELLTLGTPFNIEIKVSDFDNDILTLNISNENNSMYYNSISASLYHIEWLFTWNYNLEFNQTYNYTVKVCDFDDCTEKIYFFTTYSGEYVNVGGIVGGMSLNGFCNELSEATVYLHHYETGHSYLTYTTSSGNYYNLTNYLFTSLDKGDYFVSVSKDGYITEYVDNITYDYYSYLYEDYCLFLEGVNSSWVINVYDENMKGVTNFSMILFDIYDYTHVILNGNEFDKCSFNCSKADNQVIISNMPNSYYAFSIYKTGFLDYNYLDEFIYFNYMGSNFSSYVILQNISNIKQCNVTGYVTSSLDNSALENVKVQIYEHDFFRGNVTHTNENGFYVFENISQGLIDLDFQGSHLGFENKRGYDNFYHTCNLNQTYNMSLNVTYKTKNYFGEITICDKFYPIKDVRISLRNKLTNSTIRTSYSDSQGEFYIYNYPATPERGYYIDFYHNLYQPLTIEKNYYHFSEGIKEQNCLNSKVPLFLIIFDVTENNESIDINTDVYLKIEQLESYENLIIDTTYLKGNPIENHLYLSRGKYKASVGLIEYSYTNSIIFIADRDKIIRIDIVGSGADSIFDLLGIPHTEENFFEWLNKYGWVLLFFVFILFILVILKNQYNELKR